jgi:hypothetical protein
MVLTSIIKTETRKIEKSILFFEKNIALMQNNLYEAQLDYYYLSSPESIYKKIQTLLQNIFHSMFSGYIKEECRDNNISNQARLKNMFFNLHTL